MKKKHISRVSKTYSQANIGSVPYYRRNKIHVQTLVHTLQPGLMKDHGQQARASENFAGPAANFSLAVTYWPWSLISPDYLP